MTLQEQLLDLDVTVNRISREINAVAAMSRGLDRVDDPYADGFYAISDYLSSTSRTLRDQLDACLAAIQEQERAGVRAAFSSPKNSQLF